MVEKQESIKVLVFGTFDKIHDGHIFFLQEALKLGNSLAVCVSSDKNVGTLKNKVPSRNENERLKEVESLEIAQNVYVGDSATNEWGVIKKVKPHIVAVGYDQKDLEIALNSIAPVFGFEVVKVRSHLPETLHSSILNKK